MVVNAYIDSKGSFLGSQADELTRHQLGDAIRIKDSNYVIIKIDEREHIDYLSVFRLNTLREIQNLVDADYGTIHELQLE